MEVVLQLEQQVLQAAAAAGLAAEIGALGAVIARVQTYIGCHAGTLPVLAQLEHCIPDRFGHDLGIMTDISLGKSCICQ